MDGNMHGPQEGWILRQCIVTRGPASEEGMGMIWRLWESSAGAGEGTVIWVRAHVQGILVWPPCNLSAVPLISWSHWGQTCHTAKVHSIDRMILTMWTWGKLIKVERETSVCCSTYLCTHWLILLCALTRYRTCNIGVSGWHFNKLSYPARPSQFFLWW